MYNLQFNHSHGMTLTQMKTGFLKCLHHRIDSDVLRVDLMCTAWCRKSPEHVGSKCNMHLNTFAVREKKQMQCGVRFKGQILIPVVCVNHPPTIVFARMSNSFPSSHQPGGL